MTAADVAVIGGGIVGTAAAGFLATAGASVTLYERAAIAAGASGRNSGLVQMPFDPAYATIHARTMASYRRAGEATESMPPMASEAAGLLLVSPDPEVVGLVAAELRAAMPALRPEVLPPDRAGALVPTMAPGMFGCLVATGWAVPPAALTHALAARALARGARFRLGAAATPVVRDGRAAGVRVNGRLEPAGQVLVAAGPWSAALVDPSGTWQPIHPLWGLVADMRLEGAHPVALEEAGIGAVLGRGEDRAAGGGLAFSLVSAAGSTTIGSTFLAEEPDIAVWLPRLLEHASRFVPVLGATRPTGTRVCARPASRDGRPLLGAIPGATGLFIAAGHGPWGISSGPGSAELVAEIMLGRDRAIPAALDAARFGSPYAGAT